VGSIFSAIFNSIDKRLAPINKIDFEILDTIPDDVLGDLNMTVNEFIITIGKKQTFFFITHEDAPRYYYFNENHKISPKIADNLILFEDGTQKWTISKKALKPLASKYVKITSHEEKISKFIEDHPFYFYKHNLIYLSYSLSKKNIKTLHHGYKKVSSRFPKFTLLATTFLTFFISYKFFKWLKPHQVYCNYAKKMTTLFINNKPIFEGSDKKLYWCDPQN
ncbi:MAG: hypothetical protein JXA94_06695, partial [Parachlamydiales bacterium]|nr:hypothetical protein [Parachlamydiales bacterium]